MIALLNRLDEHHEECRHTLRKIKAPMLTVWPAYTEAMHLLRVSASAQAALWDLVLDETIAFLEPDKEDCRKMRDLMKKYRDLPMDLADAALVCLAERRRISRIFTLDQRHFNLYRSSRNDAFEIIP